MSIRAEIPSAVALLLVACAYCPPTSAQIIGSPVVPRQYTDVDAGQVCVYDGLTSPFPTSGTAWSWSFFDRQNAGRLVTPLVFQITANDSFTLTGIGTTRISTGTGLQSYPFGLIAGSDRITGGHYTFGFTNRAYTAFNSQPVAGTSNDGVIPFDRPGSTVPVDPWEVTAAVTSSGPVTLGIGSIIGSGGVQIYNGQDPGGLVRIYSAQMTEVDFPADFNSDGKVDFSDLLILGQHYGIASGATHATGDANDDGATNFSDLLVLGQEYGQSIRGATAMSVVPEPLWNLGFLGPALLLRRGRPCGGRGQAKKPSDGNFRRTSRG